MKFFLLDLIQKGYLNTIIFFDKVFNIGNGSKKRSSLSDLSVNMILYFFVYVFFVFVFDVIFFNEEFFISLGLILFILFVRSLVTNALMPFFFQYRVGLERSFYELSENIFLMSSKLQKYYLIELFFLSVLKKNLYGISVYHDNNLGRPDIEWKGEDIVIVNNVLSIKKTAATTSFPAMNQIEQSLLLGHLEAYFCKIFGFFVNEVFFTFIRFQYQLRLAFYASLVKNNLIKRVPLTPQEQAMSNFLIFR